ncbi:unnamed protein product [Calypogeia fissa]
MWSSVARRGVRSGLSKLGSSVSTGSWRALSSAEAPPSAQGLEFATKRYRSFWKNLKQQREGLASMALCASVGILAYNLIKRDKGLMQANESVEQLRKQNEALTKKLEGLRSVLVKMEAEGKSEKDAVALLRVLLDLDAEALLDPPAESDNSVQSTSGSKFMV